MDKVRGAILAWESEVRRYTDMSGKTLDDDDKIGGLVQIVPSQVQNHIRLNSEKADSYDLFAEVSLVLRRRTGGGKASANGSWFCSTVTEDSIPFAG